MEIELLGQCEMNDASLVRVHWSKHKWRGRRPNLPGRMMGHRSQFCFPRRAIIVGVTNDPMALRQFASEGLVQDLLQRVQQLTPLIKQQSIVGAINRQQTSLVGLFRRRVQIEARTAKDRVGQVFDPRIDLVHGFKSGLYRNGVGNDYRRVSAEVGTAEIGYGSFLRTYTSPRLVRPPLVAMV